MTAEMRELIARQNTDRANESAAALRSLLAPADEADWPAVRRSIADRQKRARQDATSEMPEETK